LVSKLVRERLGRTRKTSREIFRYPLFRQTWERKIFYRKIYAEWLKKPKWMWVKIKTFPNLGGVPLIEGETVKVEVEKEPRLRRKTRHIN